MITLFRILPAACIAVVLNLAISAGAQDLPAWSRLVSFRPDPKLQEKLQSRAADANGNRPHILKIEHARGNLLLHKAELVVNKMPAAEGKPMSVKALMTYIRAHMMDMVDPAKDALVLEDDKQKAQWESESADGVIIKWIDKRQATELSFLVTESASDRCVFSTMQSQRESQAHLFSGNIQISVTSAAPLDGCLISIRGAVRPTAAATKADEWALAERFAGFWLDLLEQIRGFVKKQDGDCIPELTPPIFAVVPWNAVAKGFHVPQEPWVGLEGTWTSTDREKRFRIEFRGESNADLIERNRDGKEIRVAINVIRGEGDNAPYILERPNDNDELLTFYDFKSTLRTAIIERKPEPSKMVLKRNANGKMIGQWYGLSISRDVYGNLQELKSPSKGTPRIYEFIPAGD